MDPRDPRSPGSVPPFRSPEDYGPVAPEPKWDRPVRPPFNRERFLLYCVGFIIFVQFSLLILAGAFCGYGYITKVRKITSATDTPVVCPTILDKIKESAGESLAVLLALLGGGTIAVGEYQRRHPPEDDPRNPRR